MEDAGGGEAPTNQGGDLSSAPPSHSETNVQVEGVDEADIVKTDGNYLYLLQGTELAIVNAWPAETMSVGSTQAIEGHPLEMFLTDEHVVVFSTVWQDGGRGVPEWDYGYYGEPLTFEGDPDDDDALIEEKVARVKGEITRMIEKGLAERPGVFT